MQNYKTCNSGKYSAVALNFKNISTSGYTHLVLMYFSKFLMRKFKGSDYQAIRDLPCHQTRQVFQSQEVQGCLDLP
jgi:hypothetical protein